MLKIAEKLFGAHLNFQARLFNILAIAGSLVSLTVGVIGLFINAGLINFVICMTAMILAIALLWFSLVSGKYRLCYMITVITVFIIFFPILFFNTGGYRSGMPSFFVLAILFTIFMIDGKKMYFMVILEFAIYISICVYAYFYPENINQFKTESDNLIDIITGFVVTSVALGVAMTVHLQLYNKRQKELESAQKQMEEYAKMKSELFAGMSHEMRTPLTVMSAYAQFAVEQIRESTAAGLPGANEQTLSDLATISDEAKRLAEMADGTLKILTSTAGAEEKGVHKYLPVNMGVIASRLGRLLEHVASKKGEKLKVVIKDKIPEILGDTDALTQLVWNILQNAIAHSNGENIILNVEADNPGVKITVIDDGDGIDSYLLPHILERGISGKKGGSGYGLSICRDIALRHNGDITVKSKKGEGASVIVLLRGMEEQHG